MVPLLIGAYASAEVFLAVHISLANAVVIWVYFNRKHIRTPTNAYIFSLAIADFLAGFVGIPVTVFSVLTRRPGAFLPCLAVHLILCFLCTVSTFHLLSIAIDKYLTICLSRWLSFEKHSMSTRQSRAKALIICSWIGGIIIAVLPLFDAFGFASSRIKDFRGECHFTDVVDYRYLVYVIFFGTILLPSIMIIFCYMSIYSRIRVEERQIKCLLRASERQRRITGRRKLIRTLLILVLAYAISWYPLYLINTYDLFLPSWFPHAGPTLTLITVVLSHVNCALNPLIYAYGMPGFKQSLRQFLPACLGVGIGGTTAAYSSVHKSSKQKDAPGDLKRQESGRALNYHLSLLQNSNGRRLVKAATTINSFPSIKTLERINDNAHHTKLPHCRSTCSLVNNTSASGSSSDKILQMIEIQSQNSLD